MCFLGELLFQLLLLSLGLFFASCCYVAVRLLGRPVLPAGIRVVISGYYQSDILRCLHENHSENKQMKFLARLHARWPNRNADVEQKVSKCKRCHQQQPLMPNSISNVWIWTSKPWQRIPVDFAGPFMTKRLVIVVDSHSKWVDVFSKTSTTAIHAVNKSRNILASYGIPEQLVSDI